MKKNLQSGLNKFNIRMDPVLPAERGNSLPLEYPREAPSRIPYFWAGIIAPVTPNPKGFLEPFRRLGPGFELKPFEE
jgi:hypothetical protein